MTLHQLLDYLSPSHSRRLLGFILASLLFHIALFIMVEVELPQNIDSLKRPEKVTLWTPSLSEGKRYFSSHALDLFDPTRIVYSNDPLEDPLSLRKLTPADYTSLPLEFEKEGRKNIVDNIVITPPDIASSIKKNANSSLNNTPGRLPHIEIETPPPPQGSRIVVTGELSRWKIIRQPELPEPVTNIAHKSVLIGLKVNRDGIVTMAYLDVSCGDSSLDKQALQAIRKLRFEPPENNGDDTWGNIRVYWNLKERNLAS